MFLVYRKSQDSAERKAEPEAPERVHQTLKLTDQYLALLVLVFTHAGLLDVSADHAMYNHSLTHTLL